MTPVCRLLEDITLYEMQLYVRVKEIVQSLREGLTCHEVCKEVVEQIPELIHVKGRFHGFDHSWLEIKNSKTIIDPYPWCVGSGPVILTREGFSPWSFLYLREDEWRERNKSDILFCGSGVQE